MTAFLTRLAWKLRGRRLVRIQLINNKGADAGAVDGILLSIDAGHYKLANCYFYEHRPGAEGTEMIGETWIPNDRVMLLSIRRPA